MTAAAAAEIAAIAAGAAIVMALLGLAALRLVRTRSVLASIVTASTIGVLGVVAGAVAVGQAMFLSEHDLRVMLAVCAAAALCSVATAVVVGRQLAGSSRRLRRATAALGTGENPRIRGLVLGRELADVATELEQTSARLAESQAREQAVEQSRRELIAWVSHDLRTPLAGVRAMSESLEDGVATDPALYHKRIRQSIERMSTLVDDLFELSRMQLGDRSLSPARVSLYDLVSDAMAEVESLAAAHGVRLIGDDVEAVPVTADGREIARAIGNLLVNAVRATPHDGTVAVAVRRERGTALVTVTDGCGGIGGDEIDRVFETGWRGTASRSPGDGGAGLGLAIVRAIVEAHNGTASVCNVRGGCRFQIALPLGE